MTSYEEADLLSNKHTVTSYEGAERLQNIHNFHCFTVEHNKISLRKWGSRYFSKKARSLNEDITKSFDGPL